MPGRIFAAALLVFSLSLSAPLATIARQQQQQPASPVPNAQQTAPPTQANQQTPQTPPRDPNDPIEKIKDEGLNRSQVMKTLSYLTDVIGPRLTNSPNMKRANEWTRDQLTQWGSGKRSAWRRGVLLAVGGRLNASVRKLLSLITHR
ncbi:MAG: hypothetical protein WKF84_05780 [Pyrinomonadaceae bacterium]